MTNIDPAIRTALAKTWLVSDRGRLMAGAELGEWVDALAPTVQGLIAAAVDAARAKGYEQGKAAERQRLRRRIVQVTQAFIGQRRRVSYAVVLAQFSEDVRKVFDAEATP